MSTETLRPKKIGHKEKNATGVKINTAEKPYTKKDENDNSDGNEKYSLSVVNESNPPPRIKGT
ncbi:hypothetical protein ACFFJN_07115 [Erwinia mallotivora]|uniref:hypothetical protein n=1 Tax=Erwinia mallotivora TaxID=69222 RepID=UPI0035ED11D5